ncbi:hypothetical protein G9A89_012446 [Geosiphon pyriformis]|nr:hypothetical protein G9A89_012446 [Geosiphon pyriformis]
MTTNRVKNKKVTNVTFSIITNKVSTRESLSVIEAARQNVLATFPLKNNSNKLPLAASGSFSSPLAGSSSLVKISPSVVSTTSKSPKIFNNRPVNKLVFSALTTPTTTSITTALQMAQAITTAMITPNFFVVPDEIFGKISIAAASPILDMDDNSSGTSSKIGQDQPLAVLPNVVSSGRSLPVLEAKQFSSVESPVLGNWTDEIETDSSSPLVSGATSGGTWETITSCQRFAGWIKLAHVKAVFQSVHGFLGAKSVSKDNVKLFCVEFASQQFLEAAFLVELTSSVHLATFKIAKSLVVSESGSSSAAVALRDVPLGVSAADIKLALSVFGSVACVVLKPAGIWQYVVVYFEKLDSAVSALKHWSVLMGKDSVRILPLVNQNETILSCDKFKTKLVNLSPGCIAFEISNMIFQIGGNLDSAVVKSGILRKCHIWCQEMGHLAMDCKISLPPTPKVLKVFKSCFVGSASYAKTAASSGLSEFLFLMAPLAASVADPAVGSRLDSLEKQILDLAALVKSIVEPVGSLVALVFHLLDDNAAKASAVNNFSNLLVGVSKNIACLRFEVDFGDMNYDSMLAAKPSFLSEDTIERVIALWCMSGAETRGNIESTKLFLSEFIFDSRNLNSIIERICGLGLFSPTFDSTLVFTVGSVVENALKKNKKLWLVLQDMHKAYDSVSWYYLKTSLWHIKMCDRFIKFFGSIHEDKINRVITNFGLSNDYRFVAKSGRVKSSSKMFFFFVAGAFVDDTIWISDCQALMQYVLNIASVKVASLDINGQLISIAKRGKAHRYLGIFLSTEDLSRPNLVKAHSDVHFFVNIVFRKTITDKQFSYLVLAVLQPIVSYRTQFSFVSSNVCYKWDALVKKSLKLKAGLFCDFPDAALHHFLLYGLKSFEQIQAESKLVAVVMFFNALGILGQLFEHRFLDLQFLVKLRVSPVNNFLAGMGLSLINLNSHLGFCMMVVLCHPIWLGPINFLKFSDLHSSLHKLWSGPFEIFTDDLLKDFGSSCVANGAAVYFLTIDCSIGIRVCDLMFSILAELQAVALALECVSSSNAMVVHLDSQAAIDAYVSELCYIFNLIRKKDLSASWVKVKSHSGVCGNVKADTAAGATTCSWFSLPIGMQEQLLIAESIVMSGNAHHFVKDLFRSVCCARWKAGPGHDIIQSSLIECVNWSTISRVWHPDSHMLTGFTSWKSSKLYNKSYPGVLCLLCRKVELSNHVFSCAINADVYDEILAEAVMSWVSLLGSCVSSSSAVLQFFSRCFLDIGLYSVMCKRFVMSDWCLEAVEVFEIRKVAVGVVVNFVRSIAKLYCSRVWLVKSSYRVNMKKAGTIGDDGVISGLSCYKTSVLSQSVVRMLGVLDLFSVSFGRYKSGLFFSGLDFSS